MASCFTKLRLGLVAMGALLPASAWAEEIAPKPLEASVAASAAEEANAGKYKSISNAIWMRIGNTIANKMGADGDERDVALAAEVNAMFSGRAHRYLAWQANFVGLLDAEGDKSASILDLHAKIELHESLNVWLGRMLVPSDRSNFSGPWFSSAWSYPGTDFRTFVGPKTDGSGRDNGATIWGQLLGGHLKYYASAFNLDKPELSPLYSARISGSILGAEPGFYSSSTYYGTKDIVAVGLGAQKQKNGMTMTDAMGNTTAIGDLDQVNVDLLAEKSISGVGTFTVEGSFFKLDDQHVYSHHVMALASYLTPSPLWIGYVQPLVRHQRAKLGGSAAGSDTSTDVQVSYVLDRYAARIALGYQRRDVAGVGSDAVILGVQIQK